MSIFKRNGQPHTWVARGGLVKLTAIPIMDRDIDDPYGGDFDIDATITDVLVTAWEVAAIEPERDYFGNVSPFKFVADQCDALNLLPTVNTEARAFIGKPYREWMEILDSIDMRYHR